MSKNNIIIVMLLLFLSILFLLSLSLGAVHIDMTKIIHILCGSNKSDIDFNIVINNRLPRTIIACIAGATAAVSGLVLQYITRNPLSCPSLLGINQGALLAILLTLLLSINNSELKIFIFAIIGSLSVLTIIFLFIFKSISQLKLVLVGITINAFIYAIIQVILVFMPSKSGLILINIYGSLASSSWALLSNTWYIGCLGLLLAAIFIRRFYILTLGYDNALALGFNIKVIVAMGFFCIAFLSAVSVVLVGPILFFPLIIVYISRVFIGDNPKKLILGVSLFGACVLLFADCIMRSIYTYREVSLGIFISLIGAPLLIILNKINEKRNIG